MCEAGRAVLTTMPTRNILFTNALYTEGSSASVVTTAGQRSDQSVCKVLVPLPKILLNGDRLCQNVGVLVLNVALKLIF